LAIDAKSIGVILSVYLEDSAILSPVHIFSQDNDTKGLYI